MGAASVTFGLAVLFYLLIYLAPLFLAPLPRPAAWELPLAGLVVLARLGGVGIRVQGLEQRVVDLLGDFLEGRRERANNGVVVCGLNSPKNQQQTTDNEQETDTWL